MTTEFMSNRDERTMEDYYGQLLHHWDFEVLLTALHLNPVLRGETDDSFVVVRDYLACA